MNDQQTAIPREPTQRMIDAGKQAGDGHLTDDGWVPRHDGAEIINIWRAMWDASPTSIVREHKRPAAKRDGVAAWLRDEIKHLQSIELTDFGRGSLSAYSETLKEVDMINEPGGDIVARIRNRPNDAPVPTERLLDEAADEIEFLRVYSDRLRQALTNVRRAGMVQS